MSFLPEGYEVPKTSGNYLNKWEQGETKIRIMSDAVIGYSYFNNENKNIHMKEAPKELPADIGTDKQGKDNKVKHFWAMVVWNYGEKKIQIMEITQSSIMEPLKKLAISQSWGDPKQYDVIITRTGEKLETKYSVIPEPKTDLSEEAANAYAENPVTLKALFTGANPFQVSDATQEIVNKEEVDMKSVDENISPNVYNEDPGF